jgi:hypothetical protein
VTLWLLEPAAFLTKAWNSPSSLSGIAAHAADAPPKNQRVTSYDHCDSIMRPPRADFDLMRVFLQPGEVCRT